MFIQSDEGRLINLFLLQSVITVFNRITGKYQIAYLHTNGVITRELSFDTKEEAETKKQSIINSLLS